MIRRIMRHAVVSASRTGATAGGSPPARGKAIVGKPPAQDHADCADREPDNKRQPRSPSADGSRVEHGGQHRADGGPDQNAGATAEWRKATEKAAAPRRRMLDQKDRGGRVFAADRRSLDEAEQHQQQRCGEADLAIGRQQPNQESRDRHDRYRDGQCPLAPELLADMAKDQPAQRPHQKSRANTHQRPPAAKRSGLLLERTARRSPP